MSDKTLINIERLKAHGRRKAADSAPAEGGSLLQHLAGVLAQLTPVYRCANMRPRRTLDAYHHYQNENWKTINHAKVLLDGKGRIKGGAGGKFNGRRFGAKWRFKKSNPPVRPSIANKPPVQIKATPPVTPLVIPKKSFKFPGIVGVGNTPRKDVRDYGDKLTKMFSAGPSELQALYGKHISFKDISDLHYRGTAHFNRYFGISLSITSDLKNPKGAGATYFHESGHCLDWKIGRLTGRNFASLQNRNFGPAIKKDFNNYVAAVMNKHNCGIADAYRYINVELNHGTNYTSTEYSSVSDIFDGITGGKCSGRWGHDRRYWNDPDNFALEMFAHITEASFNPNPKRLELIKKIFPLTYREYNNIIAAKKVK